MWVKFFRRRQVEEALLLLEEELKKLDARAFCEECLHEDTQQRIRESSRAFEFLSGIRKELNDGRPRLERLANSST